MTASEPRTVNIRDDYYTDSKDILGERNIIVRYRVRDGWKHTITIKQPYIRTGMGLSRREIDTDLFIHEGFDRMAAIRDICRTHLGIEDIHQIPIVSDELLRIRMDIRSDVRPYSLSFDRIVYSDPLTMKYTVPGYELEIESMDAPINDDRSMVRLLSYLNETGSFREERISKYARGKAWVQSLGGSGRSAPRSCV